jgi:uncharacterized membrane protein SpoIIM required for sporulation
VLNLIREIILGLEGKTTIELIILIFFNNLKASFFAMLVGTLFGIFPVITGLINGYVIGFSINLSIEQAGILILWRLIPHGLFEIPAIILSMGIGLYLGNRFLEKKLKIHSINKRALVIFITSLSLIPLGYLYSLLALKSLELSSLSISSLESNQILLIFLIALINFVILLLVAYALWSFYIDKELRKDLIDSLIFFLLIIIPLLVIAAIIEGILIVFLG